METRLSSLSGDRQYGPDNGLQSKVVVEGAGHRERGSETERGRPGQGHRGREGQNGALVFRARTLYSITLLSLLQTHILLFLQHTHTHTHTTLISPLLNEVQRHLHCKQHCSLKLETSCYRPATRTWSLKTVRSSIITKRKPINILINRNKQQRKTRVWFSGSCRFTIKCRSYVYKKRKKKITKVWKVCKSILQWENYCCLTETAD